MIKEECHCRWCLFLYQRLKFDFLLQPADEKAEKKKPPTTPAKFLIRLPPAPKFSLAGKKEREDKVQYGTELQEVLKQLSQIQRPDLKRAPRAPTFSFESFGPTLKFNLMSHLTSA